MRVTTALESLSRAQAVSRWRQRRRELMARAPVRSPEAAADAARSNWSVTLARALTTTTGCLPSAMRPATMPAVRLIAAGSSTEVPPNFITTTLMRDFSFSSCGSGMRGFDDRIQFAEIGEQLGVQDCGSSSAAHGVVRE